MDSAESDGGFGGLRSSVSGAAAAAAIGCLEAPTNGIYIVLGEINLLLANLKRNNSSGSGGGSTSSSNSKYHQHQYYHVGFAE